MKVQTSKDLTLSLINAVVSADSARAIELLAAGANPRVNAYYNGRQQEVALLSLMDAGVFKALLLSAGPRGLEGQFNGKLLRKALGGQACMQVIRALIQESIGAPQKEKEDALLLAISYMRQDVACEMTRGNWLPKSGFKEKMLAMAAEHGMIQLAALILKEMEASADTPKSWPSALAAAVGSGTVEICEMLLAAGTDPNSVQAGKEGSLLGRACASQSASAHPITRVLIKAGADIEARGEAGVSVLMWAARAGNTKGVEVLLKAGAEVDKKDERGATALMWACVSGGVDAVRLLVAAGADPNVSASGPLVKSPGVTAAMLCCEKGHSDCLNALIGAGANLDARDAEGRTVKEWTESCKVDVHPSRTERYAACEELALSALERIEISKVAKMAPQGSGGESVRRQKRFGL